MDVQRKSLFYQNILAAVSAAFKHAPQITAMTFAFSSVFILLLWSKPYV